MEKQEQGGPKNDDRGLSGYIESEHQGSASRTERRRIKRKWLRLTDIVFPWFLWNSLSVSIYSHELRRLYVSRGFDWMLRGKGDSLKI